jgi:hypothetical protein
MIAAAATEPMVPALLQPLLDKGFIQKRTFDWWLVPAFIVQQTFGYCALIDSALKLLSSTVEEQLSTC